jgi:integrase
LWTGFIGSLLFATSAGVVRRAVMQRWECRAIAQAPRAAQAGGGRCEWWESDETFLYTRQDGEPMQPRSLSQMWSTISTTLPRIRFHDLRHAHATHMLASGVHPKVASERLGHSRVGITLDLYSHVLPGMQEDAAARVDEAFQIAQKKLAENIG